MPPTSLHVVSAVHSAYDYDYDYIYNYISSAYNYIRRQVLRASLQRGLET